jgi:hypothetical protein
MTTDPKVVFVLANLAAFIKITKFLQPNELKNV